MCTVYSAGTRKVLLQRLTSWHRSEHTRQCDPVNSWGHQESQENIPMNVEGNNFSLYDLRDDLKSLNATNLVINTEFKNRYEHHDEFAPLQHQRGAFTTGKSILKKHSMAGEYFMQTKPSSLSFSPFNAVRIIPHRYDLHKVSHVLFSDDDDEDEDSRSEEEEEEEEHSEDEGDADEEMDVSYDMDIDNDVSFACETE
jgi:hypothetical protein